VAPPKIPVWYPAGSLPCRTGNRRSGALSAGAGDQNRDAGGDVHGFSADTYGGLWFAFGTRWMRAALFPILFLWILAPLPGPLLNDLTLGTQHISTVGGYLILKLMGLHPSHVGNMIYLENFTLNVDVPCSGFKLLLSLLMFSAAFAFLTDTTLARRWALFLFSLPLSILVNSIRITLIGLVGEAMGASAAETFHDWSGMICLILCMALLFGGAKALGCRTFAGQPIF
jgi:exosortase